MRDNPHAVPLALRPPMGAYERRVAVRRRRKWLAKMHKRCMKEVARRKANKHGGK